MNYPNLPKDCTSMLCKHLTPEVFEELKDKKTSNGFTLEVTTQPSQTQKRNKIVHLKTV